MPNIEVYGKEKKDQQEVINAIYAIFLHNFPEKFDDVVITFVNSGVYDLFGSKKPFVRVYHTNLEEAKQIAKVLSAYMDAEVMLLTAFFENSKA
ncbi:MAG: hypothetical protein WCX74_02090 [Candidatus Paceibacterota bacterium]